MAQDEAFMYQFDFMKLAPAVVFNIITKGTTPQKSLSLATLVNESALIIQLATYVRELSTEDLETFTIDGTILKRFTLQ